jgi:hypothetical protein
VGQCRLAACHFGDDSIGRITTSATPAAETQATITSHTAAKHVTTNGPAA